VKGGLGRGGLPMDRDFAEDFTAFKRVKRARCLRGGGRGKRETGLGRIFGKCRNEFPGVN